MVTTGRPQQSNQSLCPDRSYETGPSTPRKVMMRLRGMVAQPAASHIITGRVAMKSIRKREVCLRVGKWRWGWVGQEAQFWGI